MKAAQFEELKEQLAANAHKSWSGWMEYLFGRSAKNSDGSVTIPKELVERWERQMNTPYADLPENEKKSDQEEVDKVLTIIEDLVLIGMYHEEKSNQGIEPLISMNEVKKHFGIH